jgi:hypothetical protein
MGERQLANLGVKRLHVDCRRGRAGSRLATEHPGSSLQELGLPGRDLVRVHVELLGQFGQRLLTFHGSQRHLRLEGRGMVPPGSLAHRLSCPAAILAASRQQLHSSNPFRFTGPALLHWCAINCLDCSAIERGHLWLKQRRRQQTEHRWVQPVEATACARVAAGVL